MSEVEMKTKDDEFKQEIDDMNETELYFVIDEIGAYTWRMNHDMADGRIELKAHASIDKDIARMHKHQGHAVERLRDVVEGLDPTNDGIPTDDYWKWYRWWDAWKKGMPDEQWNEISAKMKRDEDISSYRPEGSWR